MNTRFKKLLLLTLRIAMAAAGAAFIVSQVNWHDRITIDAGSVLTDGMVVAADYERAVDAAAYEQWRSAGSLDMALQVEGTSSPAVITAPFPPDGEQAVPFSYDVGLRRLISQARLPLLVGGFALTSLIYGIIAFRWWILMRARQLDVSLHKAFQLTMVGSFFNYCLPGSTGGDLVKAFYIARHSHRRADAVMTVFVDRITGLTALILLAATAGLFMWRHDMARSITLWLWSALAVGALGYWIYSSPGIRRFLRLGRLVQRLPGRRFIEAIDRSIVAYRQHKGAVLAATGCGLVNHFVLVASTAMAGYALGTTTPLGLLITVVPLVFLAASIPLTYQGLGVMEGVALALISKDTADPNQIVGMLMCARIYQAAYGLAGGIYVIRHQVHAPSATAMDNDPSSDADRDKPIADRSTDEPAADSRIDKA